MSTLVLGFVALVLIPAIILSVVVKRMVRVPVECPYRDDQASFILSLDRMACEETDITRKQL